MKPTDRNCSLCELAAPMSSSVRAGLEGRDDGRVALYEAYEAMTRASNPAVAEDELVDGWAAWVAALRSAVTATVPFTTSIREGFRLLKNEVAFVRMLGKATLRRRRTVGLLLLAVIGFSVVGSDALLPIYALAQRLAS